MPRLFHTLVVYGASVTLSGCGGRADDATDTAGGGSAGDGGTSGASASDAGASAASGGTARGGRAGSGGGGTTGGSGGVQSSGARGGVASGGDSGGPGTGGAAGGGAEPSDWTFAQWDCDTEATYCSNVAVLAEPCDVDPRRPTSLDDCAPGEWLECHRAELDGRELVVNCTCIPPSEPGLCAVCADGVPTGTGAGPDSCDGPIVLCTCYPLIR